MDNNTLPTIETKRLILRQAAVDDAQAYFEWAGDQRVTKYMSYRTYSSVEEVRDWLKTVPKVWVYVRKSDGLLIGSGDISPDGSGDGFWEFGYNLRFDCWNKGYATEAVKAMIRYAYDQGARKFTAQHAVENAASGRVMEKCGLKFVGHGSYKKADGSCEFRSKIYKAVFEEIPF